MQNIPCYAGLCQDSMLLILAVLHSEPIKLFQHWLQKQVPNFMQFRRHLRNPVLDNIQAFHHRHRSHCCHQQCVYLAIRAPSPAVSSYARYHGNQGKPQCAPLVSHGMHLGRRHAIIVREWGERGECKYMGPGHVIQPGTMYPQIMAGSIQGLGGFGR